jgi:hypothetical protein
MALSVSRFAALFGVALALATPVAASAQSQDKDSKDTKAADTKTAQQRKIDLLNEAARSTAGAAANKECIWHGITIVGLLWNEDIDTALRHLQIYDRFNCPSQHLQLAYRCFLNQGPPDPKAPDPINNLAKNCWMNPGSSSSSATTATTNGSAGRPGSSTR